MSSDMVDKCLYLGRNYLLWGEIIAFFDIFFHPSNKKSFYFVVIIKK